jgi:hypothetical protein
MNFSSVLVPIPQNGPPRVVPITHRGAQPLYMNQVLPPVPGYGISPGAQYGVPQAGMTQPAGSAGLGQGTTLPAQPLGAGLNSQYYNQLMQPPMGQGVPGAANLAPGASTAAAPPPNTTAPDQYGQPDHHEHYGPRRRRSSHRIRDILRDLLAGTALAAIAEHHHKKHHRDRSPDTVNPEQPPPQHAPHGSALGFLHPKGHFQPASLEAMIEHFVHEKKDRGIAPEGARPGYLHTGGHFIPMGMEHLVEEFKHTLLHGPRGHDRRGRRGRGSSSESDYSD